MRPYSPLLPTAISARRRYFIPGKPLEIVPMLKNHITLEDLGYKIASAAPSLSYLSIYVDGEPPRFWSVTQGERGASLIERGYEEGLEMLKDLRGGGSRE